MNDHEPAIVVKNLHKTFRLPREQHNGIKQSIVSAFRGERGYATQHVLKNISFEVQKGEFFGIVGRNGSGKSTLLKLLAGIYTPDEGIVEVNGSLTPFIELGVGFNPELTGRENVFMNGALLGFDRTQMEAMYDDIVEFAELRDFMDQKLKNYSSGMQVRLAFSIAIRANSSILLLDEVLAVGDAAFQQKCYDYFDTLKKAGQTIIIVTHDMGAVRRFCTRAVLIENGKVKTIGSPDEVSQQYTLDNFSKSSESDDQKNKKLHVPVKSLEIVPVSKSILSKHDSFVFDVTYELSKSLPVDLGMSIIHENISLIEQNTKHLEIPCSPNVVHTVRYEIPLIALNTGKFRVDIAIFEKSRFELIGFNVDSCDFLIEEPANKQGGILSAQGVWHVKDKVE